MKKTDKLKMLFGSSAIKLGYGAIEYTDSDGNIIIVQDKIDKTLNISGHSKVVNNSDDKLKIYNFINNELIETVRTAKNCETEVAFTISKQAQQLYKESISEKEVILQGVVDLLVILNEKEYMIIDYKTDNVSIGAGESILIERHKEQLRIYKEAVEQYYCVENVQTYIYSYTLSKLIKVEC